MTRRKVPETASGPGQITVAFEIVDIRQIFHITADAGGLRIDPDRSGCARATVRLPHHVWNELLIGGISLPEALLEHGVETEGDLAELVSFHRQCLRHSLRTDFDPGTPRHRISEAGQPGRSKQGENP